MKDFLIPECHFEKELLIMLGFSLKTDINKAIGCSGVLDAMKSEGYKQQIAIGWIDQDPLFRYHRHPDYFHFKECILPRFKIRLLRKPNTRHYLIEIEDEFELWFEPIGKSKGIRKEKFGIDSNLHNFSKKQIPEYVRKYLRAVIDADSPPFDYIKDMIQNIRLGKI
jgi:hypothetical protein